MSEDCEKISRSSNILNGIADVDSRNLSRLSVGMRGALQKQRLRAGISPVKETVGRIPVGV